jgi:hypothetical protein
VAGIALDHGPRNQGRASERSFAEPCCGDYALVRHLESFGLRCAYAGDIATGQDALSRSSFGKIDAIITNPPHSREIMHRMIMHFMGIAPTWLLIDNDWSCNEHAGPFLPFCSDIVAIGRVKWIAGSAYAGMENYGWYRFDANHSAGPAFHGRGAAPVAGASYAVLAGAPICRSGRPPGFAAERAGCERIVTLM